MFRVRISILLNMAIGCFPKIRVIFNLCILADNRFLDSLTARPTVPDSLTCAGFRIALSPTALGCDSILGWCSKKDIVLG